MPRDSAPLVAGALAGMGALLAVATLTRGEPERWHLGRAASLLAVVTVAGAFATLAGEVAARTGRDPVDPRTDRATS
ncbi:MAG: hypothetical protein GWO22_19750, partial [Actinobacteria bacterium]|nr:hypothetical protein [Actinomycetota bacterium]